MGISKRRVQEIKTMKSKILNESIKIINEEGFDKLSMRKIAERIDYSPTTIYLYYKNKAQIAEDIGLSIYEKIVSDITQLLFKYPNLSIESKLKKSLSQFILSMTSNPEMGRALIKSGSDVMFKMKDSGTHGENMLQSLLNEGGKQGVLRNIDDHSSWMILSALIGFGMNAIENEMYQLDNWLDLVDEYTSVILYGFVNDGGK